MLDFQEIAQANKANGKQDEFELFSRDFLEYLGYHILSDPDRGADGGIDIKVEEQLTGIRAKSSIIWLVSCKHKAHSGTSVVPKDEINITERVYSKGCSGFFGLYSTLASSGLTEMLEGLKNNRKLQYEIFDYRKIEKELLKSKKGEDLARRYFPKSTEKPLIYESLMPNSSNEDLSEVRNSYYEEYISRKRKKN